MTNENPTPDEIRRDAANVQELLPHLFRYATTQAQEADEAGELQERSTWVHVRRSTARLIADLNNAPGIPTEPEHQEYQLVEPTQAFTEAMPELTHLTELAGAIARSCTAYDDIYAWERVGETLMAVRLLIQRALQHHSPQRTNDETHQAT